MPAFGSRRRVHRPVPDEYRLSELAYGFIAGQLSHARSLAAIVAPTVNSYKRLVPGYEAPVYVGWAQINRSALIRIPRYTEGRDKATRAELRFPDPSANPYLALSVMLAAALDGIDNHLPCPEPLNNVNVYHLTAEERAEMDIAELPGSLAEVADQAIVAGALTLLILRPELRSWPGPQISGSPANSESITAELA